MSRGREVLASVEFAGTVIEWRGPAPFLFVPIPDEQVGEIRYAARLASYGWGVIPVEAKIGGTEFTTSLFPRSGTYLLPIKVAVQRAEGVSLGDEVSVVMRITGNKIC